MVLEKLLSFLSGLEVVGFFLVPTYYIKLLSGMFCVTIITFVFIM